MRNDHTGHVASSSSNEHARQFESKVIDDEYYDEDDSEIFLLPGRDVPIHSHGIFVHYNPSTCLSKLIIT